ncbi:hypothetical protein ADZ37_16620 [Pannonibacter phragmitetus]|nr:hypothetical protein ADZ37_16620 [Pannonibacter phragmitetus]
MCATPLPAGADLRLQALTGGWCFVPGQQEQLTETLGDGIKVFELRDKCRIYMLKNGLREISKRHKSQ